MSLCYQRGQQGENITQENGSHDKSLTRKTSVNFHVSKKTICSLFTTVKQKWQFLTRW